MSRVGCNLTEFLILTWLNASKIGTGDVLFEPKEVVPRVAEDELPSVAGNPHFSKPTMALNHLSPSTCTLSWSFHNGFCRSYNLTRQSKSYRPFFLENTTGNCLTLLMIWKSVFVSVQRTTTLMTTLWSERAGCRGNHRTRTLRASSRASTSPGKTGQIIFSEPWEVLFTILLFVGNLLGGLLNAKILRTTRFELKILWDHSRCWPIR